MRDSEYIELTNLINDSFNKLRKEIKTDMNELRTQSDVRFNSMEAKGIGSGDDMDSSDVMRHFNISRSTLNRYIKLGLKSYKANGRKHGKLFFKKQEVKLFINGK